MFLTIYKMMYNLYLKQLHVIIATLVLTEGTCIFIYIAE